MEKQPSIRYFPVFATMTQSLPAAVMLSQLWYWFEPGKNRVRIERGGKRWVARSFNGWAEELGLTRQEARSATVCLSKMGLIETQVWKFDRNPTTHYHLDLKALSCCLQHTIVLVATQDRVGSNQSITEITTETTTETLNTSDAVASHEITDETMASKTAREVLEGIQKKIAQAPTKPEKVTAKSLSMFWQKLVPKFYDIGFQKPHTMKELGMFSQYAKLTGIHALPAMEWAIKEWDKFRYRVKEELGEESTVKPHIACLLKGCAVAVEGYQKVGVPVHSEQPLQMNAPIVQGEEEDAPATKEEIEAMLKSMGEK